MLISFIALTMISTSALAGFPSVDIQKFVGEYTDPQGTAEAEKFRIPERSFGEGKVNFEVFRQAGVYVLRANQEEFRWENPPMGLDEVKNLKWDGVEIKSSEEKFSIQVDSLDGSSDKESVRLRGLKFSCDFADIGSENPTYVLLHSCLNNEGSLSIAGLAQNKQELKKVMESISNLKMNMKKNNFTFTITSGLSINGYGKVWFLPEEKMVKIRVDAAKWKFVNVKARLFAELKKLEEENENVKVQNPWIEIGLE